MTKKSVIRQVVDSGEVTVRGERKPLRLLITMDAMSGKIIKVEKTRLPVGTYPTHKIRRREYYDTLRTFLPKKKMTEEERKKAHVAAELRYRRKKNVRPA